MVLIDYLENNTAPSSPMNIGHHWAKSPTTIGSIAAMYMCILFI